ncbi:MAG: hypothetical protein OEY67_02015 [Gammaproteobacteria bacterium]|nr:hypothetical protein [Gammaproteobacteria bacterium]
MPVDRGMRYWLPAYLAALPSRLMSASKTRGVTRHILFLVCDHFEPRHKIKQEGQDKERMATWLSGYPEFAERCRKQFGHTPKHTWFYPPHHGLEHLDELKELVFRGYGEIDLHYHHDNDTSESLTADLTRHIAEYNRRGILLTSGEVPETSFGFIHGDWALDNSAHGKYCGVNDELTILQSLGCWGDFTMPSTNECQTRKINSIYYAIDDTEKPKSHDRGPDVMVGKRDQQGLFMLQGPLGINFRAPKHPRVENASLTTSNWGRPDRARCWVNAHVHVRGRPEWQFIKLHCHGAVEKDHDALFGERAFAMHRYLNENYNDGKKFKLHYVTAREAYNICKAAEAGYSGNPADYKDYKVAPYATRFYTLTNRHKLVSCTEDKLIIEDIENSDSGVLKLNSKYLEQIKGRMEKITIKEHGKKLAIRIQKGANLEITWGRGVVAQDIQGATEVAGNPVKLPEGCFLLNASSDLIEISAGMS